MKICIFGAASAHIDDIYIKTVEDLGELMAKRGHSLVFGGGKFGLMGAISNGVKKQGGSVCAVIPHFFQDEQIELMSVNCDEVIHTATMAERKDTMGKLADAFIILPGGLGTLDELFEIYTLIQLGRYKKPLAVLNIQGYYDDLKKFLDSVAEKKFVTKLCLKVCQYFDDFVQLLDYLEEFQPSDFTWNDLLYNYDDE